MENLEYTNGYIGSMGGVYKNLDSDEIKNKIALASEYNGVSVDVIKKALDDGYAVKTGETSPNYYYDHGMAMIRKKPAPKKTETRKRYTCKSCGVSGYVGSYPFSTTPDSGHCDDCL